MKEVYFTPDRVEEQSAHMLAETENIVRLHQMRYAKGHAALLIVDMQEYFLQESSHAYVPSAPAVMPAIAKLREAFAIAGEQVIFTRHVNSPDDAGMMRLWWKDLVERENPLSEISTCLNASGSMIIEKNQYDAFHATSLESVLTARRVSQLVICGLTTNLCCETTARSAFVRGFEVILVADATATYNASLHRATLLNLAHGFASLVLTRQLLTELR